MQTFWRGVALLASLVALPATAGEIPGLPTQLPPFNERDFELAFSNDFFGRGGSVDDFRTQQIIVTAKLSERWSGLIDHSILTLDNGSDRGRTDQLSASLGYDLVSRNLDSRIDIVTVGFGVRSAGSFAGERMQNGFHRLVGSKVEDLPYVFDDSTDATVWLHANHYREYRDIGEDGLLSGWRRGAWVRAGSLATTGGQWDSTLSALAVVSRPSIDIWLGVRSDWRSGYEDLVLRETARAEQDVGIVVGARFGALVIETVQQLNNAASFGQLRLVSTGRRKPQATEQTARLELDFGFTLPDVQLRVAGKYPGNFFLPDASAWRESLVLAASYGEPQYGNNNGLFIRSGQLDFGLELERGWHKDVDWLSVYATTAVGWREQSLVAVNELRDTRSESIGRAVLSVGTGVRVDAAGSESWRLRIHTGLVGILPVSDASLEFAGESYRLQKNALNLLVGFTVEFE